MKKEKDVNLKEESVNKIIENAFKQLQNVINADVIVGNPINVSESIAILPISKVNAGFVAGGGEIKKELKKCNNFEQPFTGGSGSGFSITPVGCITIVDKIVKYIAIEPKEMYQEVFNITNKIVDKILKDKEENEEQ